MNFKIDKELVKMVGNGAWRLTKKIAWEGTKAVAVETATKAIKTGFDSGMDGVKQLKFDDIVGKEKVKEDKPKKKWFPLGKKKDQIEEILEEAEESAIDWKSREDDEEIETLEGEIIDKK